MTRPSSVTSLALVVSLAGAAAFAYSQRPDHPPAGEGPRGFEGSAGPVDETRRAEAPSLEDPSLEDPPLEEAAPELPAGHPPLPGEVPGHDQVLPPGHPSIADAPAAPLPPRASDDEGALAWDVPARWELVPSPSTFRLATYRVPPVAPDTEDATMVVSRAGGSVEANVARWRDQFDEASQKSARVERFTVRNLAVTVLRVEGRFAAAMPLPGTATGTSTRSEPSVRDAWGFVGVIVDTPGDAHFLKLTGPVRSVRAASPELDALVRSLRPRGAAAPAPTPRPRT